MKTTVTSKTLQWVMLAGFMILLTSCANNEMVEGCFQGKTYGFLWGLWHGIIAPVDLVLMFFRDDITVYAPNNNGFWYALGFLLGSGGWGLMGGKRLGGRK
jgi:hypothetical protein